MHYDDFAMHHSESKEHFDDEDLYVNISDCIKIKKTK
jgi:hypothetical protein